MDWIYFIHTREPVWYFSFFMWRIMSLISTVHLTRNQQEQQHWSCSRLLWMSLVCFLACLLCVSACVHVCLLCSYMRVGHMFFDDHTAMNPRFASPERREKASMTGEHPWLVGLRRQRSRFTLLIQSILCWRGVAKQPQGNEWDSNSGGFGTTSWIPPMSARLHHMSFFVKVLSRFQCKSCELANISIDRKKKKQKITIRMNPHSVFQRVAVYVSRVGPV